MNIISILKFSALIILASISFVQSSAAASARVSGRISNAGQTLSLSIKSPGGLYCTAGVLFTTSKVVPSAKSFRSGAQLPLFNTNQIVISDLKKIRNRTERSIVAYIKAEFKCNDGRTYKASRALRVPSTLRRSGFANIGRWISAAKHRLTAEAQNLSAVPFPPSGISLVQSFSNLAFSAPIDLKDAGDDSNSLYVAEQGGKIYSFVNAESSSQAGIFLDISDKVVSGGEQGLLGFAFHPNYKSNGYFFVNYTRKSDGATVIARFTGLGNSQQVDSSTELVLLTVSQPYSNHNGGALQFGPDGYLYIALGDGGSGGDPLGNGQNLSALLGKILRIDVDSSSGGSSYSIPPSNPFVGNSSGYKEEIFAYGFRNPWRISFDFATNRLWAADVGQGSREEVDLVNIGGNYGWNTIEGFDCYSPSSGCDKAGLTLPVVDYGHTEGQSITGGYVYRGSLVPSLTGVYLYADFITGRLWGIRGVEPLENALLLDTDLGISSFGIDRNGEVFVLDYGSGRIYRFQEP